MGTCERDPDQSSLPVEGMSSQELGFVEHSQPGKHSTSDSGELCGVGIAENDDNA
jgi:hypothetical protein